LKDELSLAGISVVNCPKTNPNYTHNRDPSISMAEFETMALDPSVKAVIAGIHYEFTFRTLCTASLYI
jgi:hypothetical protein